MKSFLLWMCFIFVCVQLNHQSVLTFNLEPRLPIVKRGNVDSYFGYSVAEHQTINEVTGQIEQNLLLVGAPRDNNLQPQTTRSGALWRCPITTRTDDCRQVVTDGKRSSSNGRYDSSIDSSELMPPLEDEIKDGQWLGVTVRSQGPGGKVMVCAHRYVRKGPDFQWGQGLCYTLTQRLDYDESWEPCKGRPTNRAHEQFGYCQAGTSGLLLNDTAIIGTPGPYTWRGTLFVISVSDDYLNRDKTFYYGPLQENRSPVDKYSYLGMSVTAGNFFGDHLSFAAGAPRANGTGQVVLFTKQTTITPMAVRLVLDGEQFASSFGYEITTADVNGDKRPDLIVGAPFYFSRDEGGAVYIYKNNAKHCLDCDKPTKLTGKVESRFGFAIANLGDLNKDGYDDIAVGAPYEDDGAVYVYLGSPQGLATEPAQVLRARDLPASAQPMKTFGYSLSGGLDLDYNGYPDLMVGAYEQDSVVLLRSRPIVGISTSVRPERNLANIDPNKPGCSKDPNSPYTCFSFEACCSIESLVKSLGRSASNITLHYSLEAEVFRGAKFSRVWIGGGGEDKRNYVVNRTVVLRPDHTRRGELHHCEEEVIYIKENTRDIQSPIKLRLSYSLVQREPRQPLPGQPLPFVDDLPILDRQEAARDFQATFQKDCGANDICESNMRLATTMQLPLWDKPNMWQLNLGEHQEVKLDIRADNHGESAYEAQLFVSHPASLHYVAHKAKTKHVTCKPFNESLVVCGMGNPFNMATPASLTLRFDPKSLADLESNLRFVVFANSTSEEVDPQGNIVLNVKVVRTAEVSITGAFHPDHVFYGGEVKGESAMEYRDDIGSRVLHIYKVFNEGPWKANNVEVVVDWPFQVANNKPLGKWLLYLEDNPTVEALRGGECRVSKEHVNPLNLPPRPGLSEPPLEALTLPDEVTPIINGTRVRVRRDTEMIVKAEAYVDKEGRRHEMVSMNCQQGTAKCIKIRCYITSLMMNEEATIRIRARLWNSTLVEDYPKVRFVRIGSRARIHLPKNLGVQDTSDDLTKVETDAYPDRLDTQEPEPVPIWIIIVAIVAGLLVLVLLTLALWKLGFFKRRRPDPTLSGNLEKSHRDDDQPS